MTSAGQTQLGNYFSEAQRIVFLTGAGMSTESGIPDFRSATGLYNTGVNERVFDIAAFRDTPELFYEFARAFLDTIRHAKPNAGHRAMAALERQPGKHVQVITQNIDRLHQEAGSSKVHQVHGTLEYSHCMTCGHRIKTEQHWPAIEAGRVPRHEACGGVFKPEIVFFGEMLPQDVLNAAERAVAEAGLLVIAGTSLQVYPAAGLPAARRPDCRLVIINQTPTPLDDEADLTFDRRIGQVLEPAVQRAAV